MAGTGKAAVITRRDRRSNLPASGSVGTDVFDRGVNLALRFHWPPGLSLGGQSVSTNTDMQGIVIYDDALLLALNSHECRHHRCGLLQCARCSSQSSIALSFYAPLAGFIGTTSAPVRRVHWAHMKTGH